MSDQNLPVHEQQIFEEAAAILDPTARKAFLDGVCRGNPALRARLDVLLEAYSEADGFLDTITDDASYAEAKLSEGPGSVIGKFKLLEQIGEGGMGVVYMAEQSVPFNKRVALKIIKLGMDTKGVVARFEAERQALALMNHPNIAKVLDAGATDTGRPYFVMELVRGVPITEYCDRNKLSTAQRLELFIPVCQAIQHAHLKGIIHRDIKPSNILVALFDGRPVPMVIDFGIAKATNQRLTEKTVFTRHAQLIGTPAYMSPEQTEGSQLDIDTRSDIYSLGVLLYELLTGSQPFPEQQLRNAGWKEMQRIIMEDDPPRPSTRFSTLTDEERTSIRKSHDEDPRKISLVLRRELDWIVMMCLEKDRAKRYETANALASDVGKYLKGEAIIAVPPTPLYQLSKLVRKHKKTFAMAAAIAVILAVATVFSSMQWLRAREEARFSKTINDFLLEDLLSISDAWAADPRGAPRKKGLTLHEAIRAAEKLVAKRFQNLPETEARVRVIIAKALAGLGEFSASTTNYQKAYQLFLAQSKFGPTHPTTLETKFWYGHTLYAIAFGYGEATKDEDRKRYQAIKQESDRLIQETADTSWQELGAAHPLTMLVNAVCSFVVVMRAQRSGNTNRVNDMALAERFHSRALASSEALTKSGDPATRAPHLLARYFLNGFTWYTGRAPENYLLERQVADDEDRYHSETNPNGQHMLHQAETLYSVAMGHYQWRRDYAKAEITFNRAMRISEEQVGPSHPTGEIHKRLADMYVDKGDYAAAAAPMFEAVRCMYEGKEMPEYSGQVAKVGAAYAAATGDWSQGLAAVVKMREQGWPVPPPILCREILLRHLLNETNELAAVRQRFWQDAPGRKLPMVARHMLSIPCPTGETNQLAQLARDAMGEGTNDDLNGVMAFRRDDWTNAVSRLESLIQHPWANYYLAMSHLQLRNPAKAREHLDRANVLFEQTCARGVLLRWMEDDDLTAETVAALILRDEAETMILGAPAKRKPFTEWLAEKRVAWEPVRLKMEEADWAARKHNYPQASKLYEELVQMPAFDFSAALELRLPYGMFTVAWALGQTNRHIEILRRMHAHFPTNETAHLFQLAEMPWPLPPDLEVRRKECWKRKDLEERWLNRNPTVQGEDAFMLGMIWYREAKDDRALFEKSLLAMDRVKDEPTFTFPTAGKAFAAMANWKLGKNDEARQLLKAADERFNTTVIVPGQGLYQLWFAGSIMMEMTIKEADQLIDPDEINAPHVAALPPEGW